MQEEHVREEEFVPGKERKLVYLDPRNKWQVRIEETEPDGHTIAHVREATEAEITEELNHRPRNPFRAAA